MAKAKQALTLYEKEELSQTAQPLSSAQILYIMQKTPSNHVYTRKGRGGQMFDYVTGTYIKKVLNYVFGWNWDFEIKEHGTENGQVWVLGKLTVRVPDGKVITKEQFGRADVKKLRDGTGTVDFGNDLKAATTDALKKCASELGIASDVYGKNEFKEIEVEKKEVEAEKPIPQMPNGDNPADEGQLKTITAMGGEVHEGLTKQEAAQMISTLAKKKGSNHGTK